MAPRPEAVVEPRGLSLAAKRLLAIAGYYTGAALLLALVWRFSPAARQLLTETLLASVTGATGAADALSRSLTAGAGGTGGSVSWQARTALLVLAGALATAIPVAWVYSLTRRRRGFEQSLVHILVLLPLAVAGMVMLIQNSLALAFSLAGIVAVLRFRNSIEDVKDGVYVFIAISIGISAGVGALTIGVVTSVVFNLCVLALWWLDFARRPTPGIRGGWRRLARLPRVAPPQAPNDKPARVERGDGDEAFASAARAWRRQLEITAEQRGATPDGRYNAALHVHSSSAEATRPALESVLRAHARRWELTGIVPGAGGTVTLKYQVAVRRSARGGLLEAVRAAPQTVGVELQ
jgi:hypothetical protein